MKDYFTVLPSSVRGGLMGRERTVNIVNIISVIFITYTHMCVCVYTCACMYVCMHVHIHVYACSSHLCTWTGVRSEDTAGTISTPSTQILLFNNISILQGSRALQRNDDSRAGQVRYISLKHDTGNIKNKN